MIAPGARQRQWRGIAQIAFLGLLAMLLGELGKARPLLVWNLSDSAPRGLYWVGPGSNPRLHDYAAAKLHPELEELAAHRHYLPGGLPLIKQVVAEAGDEICAKGRLITLFGQPLVYRESHDPAGRPMPWWNGCARLGAGEYLLVNREKHLSFDGRYTGPTGGTRIIGKAELLWAY